MFFALLFIRVLCFSDWLGRLFKYSIVEYYAPNKMTLKRILMI